MTAMIALAVLRAAKKNTSMDNIRQFPEQRIRMNISADDIASIPAWDCPEGYSLRKIQKGDEENLAMLLASAGVGHPSWDDFDEPKMIEYLSAPERRQGTHVVQRQDELCAVCFASRRADFCPSWGQLDYVCVHPHHRGQGLAFGVCAAVLRYLRSQSYKAATLTTLGILPDDHRLPAVKTYLNLGFLPVMTEEIVAICQEIHDELKWPLPVKWWKGVESFHCECP